MVDDTAHSTATAHADATAMMLTVFPTPGNGEKAGPRELSITVFISPRVNTRLIHGYFPCHAQAYLLALCSV